MDDRETLIAQRDHARRVAEQCYLAWDHLSALHPGDSFLVVPNLDPAYDDGWEVSNIVGPWQAPYSST